MFILKKLIGNLMMPLSFSLALLLLGLALLWFSHQRSNKQLIGKLFISLATVILLITSLPFAALSLNQSLERQHSPLRVLPTNLDYIIVLGHGHRSDPFLLPQQQLSTASFARLMEGVRLMQANPTAVLLLSGYGGSDPISNAKLSSIVAQQYVIPRNKIKIFETAQDTQQEAALLAPIIKQSASALVTSASHMPRSLKYFQEQGIEPIAVPTYFIGKTPQAPLLIHERLPHAGNLESFSVAWHEVVGSLWNKIRH